MLRQWMWALVAPLQQQAGALDPSMVPIGGGQLFTPRNTS